MDSDSLYHDEKVLEIFAELVSANRTKRRLDALERQEKAAVATAAKREAAAAAEEAKRETAAAAKAAKAAALRETCGAPGSRMCEHRRRRYFCKECGGGGICEHGRWRCICKDCGGSRICEHGRQRLRCKDCKVGRQLELRVEKSSL